MLSFSREEWLEARRALLTKEKEAPGFATN